MQVFTGASNAVDATAAVDEATREWRAGIAPDVVFVFVSTAQSPGAVASQVAARFPSAIVVGCTTAGEHCEGRQLRGTVALSALVDTRIRWSATFVPSIDRATAEDLDEAVACMLDELGMKRDELDADELFCLSFIDGLRGREEAVTAQLVEALDGVRLVGGSAGDDERYQSTSVIFGDRAFENGLVLLCAHAKDRFAIFKHQHFATTARRLAVTKVDPSARRVYEIDGYPAVVAYAHALGIPAAAVTPDVVLTSPVTFEFQGEVYVRSIREIHPDGSLSFFCAVDEGMVLSVAEHGDIVACLRDDLGRWLEGHERAELLIGCNCVLRTDEAARSGRHAELAAEWLRLAHHTIGVDTYGEHLDGVHLNQALVGLLLRSAA